MLLWLYAGLWSCATVPTISLFLYSHSFPLSPSIVRYFSRCNNKTNWIFPLKTTDCASLMMRWHKARSLCGKWILQVDLLRAHNSHNSYSSSTTTANNNNKSNCERCCDSRMSLVSAAAATKPSTTKLNASKALCESVPAAIFMQNILAHTSKWKKAEEKKQRKWKQWQLLYLLLFASFFNVKNIENKSETSAKLHCMKQP